MSMITQEQVDRVAAFIDACGEAKREPFFGPNEEADFRAASNWTRITFTFGDRLHFRSALIPFRRLWSSSDPAHWEATVTILKDSGLPQALELAARDCDAQARWEIDRKDPPGSVPLSRTKAVEVWMNAMVLPDPVRSKVLRAEFEAACTTYGHAAMEYAFRSAVKWLGYHFLRICDRAAEPALAFYCERGIVPSFAVGSTMRIKRREKLATGTILLRRGVSDFAPEESFEQKFQRLLGQMDNRALQAVFKYLDASSTELVLAVVRSRSIIDLLTSIGGRLEICVFPADRVGGPARDDLHASSHGAEGRFNIYANNFVVTDDRGLSSLEGNLKRFRAQLLG